jgi:hypothetical protein
MPTTRILLHGTFSDADLVLVADIAASIGAQVAIVDTDEAALVLADALQLSVLMDAVPPVASTMEQRQTWVRSFKAMMHRHGEVIAAAVDVANARAKAH